MNSTEMTRKPNSIPSIYCVKCGAFVEHPVNNQQKYCFTCSKAHQRKFRKLKQSVQCEICGEVFAPRVWNQKFCDKCRPLSKKKYYFETDYKNHTVHRKPVFESFEKKKNKSAHRDVDKIALAASKAGMTYGQYVLKNGLY